MSTHARAMVHRLMQRHIEKHSDAMDAHANKGPAFANAVAQLRIRLAEKK